ncbi:MAG: hypothetical protein ABEK12_01110, partial [Candidatus Nanohaloarchaea archaeon]
HQPEDRTDEEQRIMTEVEHRARFAAQQEFPEKEIMVPSLKPGVIERGMAATQEMAPERFEEVFREYYEAIQDPSPYLPEEVPVDRATVVVFAFTIDGTEFGEAGHVNVLYVDEEETLRTTDPNTYADGTEYVKLYFGAGARLEDLEYPKEFWEFVQTNFMYQVRDRYLQMGEEPPEEYQVDGPHIYSLVGTDEEALLD